MKLETTITAPVGGTIRDLPCAVGAQVSAGTILARIDQAGAANIDISLSFAEFSGASGVEQPQATLIAWLTGFDVLTGEASRALDTLIMSRDSAAIDAVLRTFADRQQASSDVPMKAADLAWRKEVALTRLTAAERLLQPLVMSGQASQAALVALAAVGTLATSRIGNLAASLLVHLQQADFQEEQRTAAGNMFDCAIEGAQSATSAALTLADQPIAWERWLACETLAGSTGPSSTPSMSGPLDSKRASTAIELYLRSRYSLPSSCVVSIRIEDCGPIATITLDEPAPASTLIVLAVRPGQARSAVRAASRAASALPGPSIVELLLLDSARAVLAEKQLTIFLARVLPENVRQVVAVAVGNEQECLVLERKAGVFAPLHQFASIHPALATRLELWRLAAFDCEVLFSSDHLAVVRGTAKDSAADSRMFVLGDISALPTAKRGSTQSNVLEEAMVESLERLRQTLAIDPDCARLGPNRIVLSTRHVWEQPLEDLSNVGKRVADRIEGLALDPITFRMPVVATLGAEPIDTLVQLAITPAGTQLGRKSPSSSPIRPLDPLRALVARARRQGHVHPQEIIRLMTSPHALASDFPPGNFEEHDLSEQGELVPVARAAGEHTGNLICGAFNNRTNKHPEGMRRVVIMGDPTRGLGSLGGAECRRVLAAIAWARREAVPLEWFAISSGARVAMDSGTENLDWTASVLRELVQFTQAGGVVNIVVTGINVGAQSYWNAEATMLMHTRGTLIMVDQSAMVLTGKQALDYSGGVSASSNVGIGGYDGIMGANGQAQHWAASIEDACQLLFRHYEFTYLAPGEARPRSRPSSDSYMRDVRPHPHSEELSGFITVGDIFHSEANTDRKQPFDIRSIMDAVSDRDGGSLERWSGMADAENAVVRDVHLGGEPVCMIGIEARDLARRNIGGVDGPKRWTAGTLFPQSSKKVARAINAASGSRPVVVLANLSGFDGSPESMRMLQLEYGAELARAVVNFQGRIIFCVLSRYHGGAFVVFSKRLNPGLVSIAVEGSYASVLGGAPAAAVVFARDVERRVRQELESAQASGSSLHADEVRVRVRAELARRYDAVHTIERAQRVGSIDAVVPISGLRPQLISHLPCRSASA